VAKKKRVMMRNGGAYDDLPALVSGFKTRYNKKVMILETAYPWTKDGSLDLTQKMITAGAKGIIYWEPAWITS
jgi:arabinogalactan endo-1,4-beta-galactosidase